MVYVVYGQPTLTSVNLGQIEDGDSQATRGMRLVGGLPTTTPAIRSMASGTSTATGSTTSSIGARSFAVPGDANGGAAYVIYGQSGDPADIDLAQVQQFDAQDVRGMTILGPCSRSPDPPALPGGTGLAVGGVGDINNDGAPDVAVDALSPT